MMEAELGSAMKSQHEAKELRQLSRFRVALGCEARMGGKASRGEATASPHKKAKASPRANGKESWCSRQDKMLRETLRNN